MTKTIPPILASALLVGVTACDLDDRLTTVAVGVEFVAEEEVVRIDGVRGEYSQTLYLLRAKGGEFFQEARLQDLSQEIRRERAKVNGGK